MNNVKVCKCDHCNNPVVARDMCETHYRRYMKHGTTDSARPKDWGLKEKHPLYDSWSWMKKMKGRHDIDPEFFDFWKYVEYIGDRPSKQHRLHKINPELGYIKGNLTWKEVTVSSEDKAAYAKDWRKKNPDKAKNSDLKKTFGITLDEYNIMRKNQDYCCAICKTHEDDLTYSLVVDHDHSNGKVRGLLCSKCNSGIGLLKDSVVVLSNAVSYLTQSNQS